MPSKKKQVAVPEPINEKTPLILSSSDSDDDFGGEEFFTSLKGNSVRRESYMADQLSMRLLAVGDDDAEAEDAILNEALNMVQTRNPRSMDASARVSAAMSMNMSYRDPRTAKKAACSRLCGMIGLVVLAVALLTTAFLLGVQFIGPPNQPVGPYHIVERQEGMDFFQYYTFYEGPDSVGSNGYITYVSEARAQEIGIMNITMENDELDVFYPAKSRGRRTLKTAHNATTEPFLYLSSAPTEMGPRESIRLEGKRRFNRGLFIIDVRHIPAGCGVWPAFWLTDEANWPVNGEIDIVEGVNYQSEAKTALHTTKGCDMADVPVGTMTGIWDTAVGIPNKKTGIPDMTMREARNCFVYDPHQWLNQGCVAIDSRGGSLGIPLNEKGGGIFVLEWDPVNRHLRTWVFAPHAEAPENLARAIQTAHDPIDANRVIPNPDEWPLPYGYFPLGDGTNCAASHFRNMRLVLNTAFCGSVAGNRYFLDCKNESKSYKSCNDYIKSQPKALDEAYWKIRGVYVYERKWEKAWTR